MNKWFWGICLGLNIVVTCYNIRLTHKNIEEDKRLMAQLKDIEFNSKLLKELHANEDLTEALNKKNDCYK